MTEDEAVIRWINEDEEGVVREGCSEPYLKMLIKIWPGNCKTQLKMMNQNVDD